MTIAVIGATEANLAAISRAVPGIRVHAGSAAGKASWILVATAAQRREAAADSGLPAFRVVHVPGLDRDGAVDASVLGEGLARMRELGPHAAEPAAAVTVTRYLMPWIRPALERLLGDGSASVEDRLARKSADRARDAAAEAEKTERRTMLERAGLVKPVTPEQARERAERKARRKAERRATKLPVGDTAVKRLDR